MYIRPFVPADAGECAALIETTLRVTNARDYTPEELAAVIRRYSAAALLEYAARRHTIVACGADGAILGCGAVGPDPALADACCLYTIFVLPDCQGKGIGRQIVARLEEEARCMGAGRVLLHASVTALPFYRKLGYGYQNGIAEPDEDRLCSMEKRL